MKKYILTSIIVLLMILGGYFSYRISMSSGYGEYEKLWEYRRMNPDTLVNVEMNRLFIAGHDTTYADALWIGLIQYIGDNIFNGKYQYLTTPLAESITTLHPYFAKPYNLALMLSPNLKDESKTYKKDKKTLERSVLLGEKGIEKLCDGAKVKKISTMGYSRALWEDSSIRDPCRDDMIAYNLGFAYGLLQKPESSKKAYMLASTQSGAPEASRFLAVLSEARDGDHRSAAEKFLLTALSGYDSPLGVCQSVAVSLLEGLKKGQNLKSLTEDTEKSIKNLKPPTDTKDPLAQSSTNCYNSLTRGAKQIYLTYITEEASRAPDAQSSADLRKAGILKTYPTLPYQQGWRLQKENNIWSYRPPITP